MTISLVGGDVRSGSAEAPVAGETGCPLPSWVAVAALAIVGGVLPIALAWRFGALGIPRNDDWAYVLSAFRFADSGKVNGNGWAGMNLVGQLVLSLPVVWLFGHRIAALQIEVATLGVLGLVAVFDLAKQLLSPRRALFVALMVAVGPMWASLSASYLTDIPAFALAMICLTLGSRAVRAERVNLGLFYTAEVVGLVAFTVREYAIVAPLVVGVTALWAIRRSKRPRRFAILAALLSLVAIAAMFLLWRRGLPGFRSLGPKRPTLHSVRSASLTSARSAVLVGVLVSPAVLLAGPRRLVETAWGRAPRMTVAVGLSALLGLGGEVAAQRTSAGILGPGNYVVPNGLLGTTTVAGTRPDLLPRFALAVVAAVGVLAAVLLVLAAVPPTLDALGRVRQRDPSARTSSPAVVIVAVAAIGYGLGITVTALFRLAAWDRYLLPLIPLVGVLVLRAGAATAITRGGRRLLTGGAALMVLAAFGFIFAANSASFDGTKWASRRKRQARQVVRRESTEASNGRTTTPARKSSSTTTALNRHPTSAS